MQNVTGPTPNIGVQRMSLRATADAESFGPAKTLRGARGSRLGAIVAMVCVGGWVVAAHAWAAEPYHVPVESLERLTVDAMNPWIETVASVRSADLDKLFVSDQDHLTITTTDRIILGEVTRIIRPASFTPSEGSDGDLDLRYRLTLRGKGAADIVIYATAFGDVLSGGRVYRLRGSSRWLRKVWDCIVNERGFSYAPFPKH